MLWLALHLPLLPLEAFRATLPAGTPPRPLALLAQQRVVAVDALAAARGVAAGQRRATAMALAADLLCAAAEPARDAAALRAVAHAALAFTPMVVLHDAQTLLLELRASLRLFGGLAALQRRLAQALAPLGHEIRSAAAPTALGAVLLARWLPPGSDPVLGAHAMQLPALQRLLGAVPLHLLGALAPATEAGVAEAERWADALQGLGLRTLGELRRLPRDGLTRRCGALLLLLLDRAWGRCADPREPLVAPETFDETLELQARAEHAEQLLGAAALLLARLVAWAQARQSRIAGFVLEMGHEGGALARQRPATPLAIELAEPSLDAAHLQLLLRERLARCPLAAPALLLRLRCSHLVHQPPPNAELFPGQAAPAARAQGLARLVEQLRARLGDEQVLRLQRQPDHRPEHATRLLPLGTAAEALDAAGPPPDETGALWPVGVGDALPLHRPLWLLPEPLPLPQPAADGRPRWLGRPLTLLAGPERIETGWWDGGLALRDYYVAADDAGALLWLYRERLGAVPGEPPWFLQGRFG